MTKVGTKTKPPTYMFLTFYIFPILITASYFKKTFHNKEGGTCDANSIPCKLRPESLQGEDISGKTSIMHKTLSSVGINSIHKDLQKQTKQEMFTSRLNRSSESKDTNNSVVYVNGCCSGLTMDLLMELMKDLNFEVEMFEVMDGFWGAWTVSL
ncbi:unnamed protein product [Trichobilharzia regenti]|nr:unnamed protein product [Trichobilharzia regenti]